MSRAAAVSDGTFYVYKSPNQLHHISGNGQQILQTRTLGNFELLDLIATADGGIVYTGSGGTHKVGGSTGNWDNVLYANSIRQTGDGSYIAWGDNGVVKLSSGGVQQGESYYAPGINQLVITSDNGCAFVTNSSFTRLRPDLSVKWISSANGGRITQTVDNDFVVAASNGISKYAGETGSLKWTMSSPAYNPPQAAYYYGLAPAGDGGFFQWNSESDPNSGNSNFIFRTQIRKYAADPCAVTATLTPAGSTTICKGGSVTLNANTGQNLTYQWKRDGQNLDGATSASYTATQSGNYSVTVSQAGTSCTTTSSAVGVRVTEPKVNGIAGNAEFCAGGSTTLTASARDGSEPYTFQWKRAGQVVGSGGSLTVTTGGEYTVEATDAGGCAATTASVTVRENPRPTANAGIDVSRTGTEVHTVAGTTATGGTPGYTYAWTASPSVTIDHATASNPTFGPFTANTNLTLTVTDSKGCRAEARAQVIYTACTFTARISSKGYFCPGSADTLTVQTSGGSGGYTYLWSRDGELVSDESRYRVIQPGGYSVNVTDSRGCKAVADRVTVVESPRPAASISGEAAFCKGGSTSLTANATGGTAPYAFRWLNGTTAVGSGSPLAVAVAGTYSVVATDARGCAGTSPGVAVREKGADITALATPVGPTQVLAPATVTLNANGGLGYTYQWLNGGQPIAGAASVSYTATATGSYTVAVSRDGCTVTSAPVEVSVQIPTGLEPAFAGVEVRVFPNPTTGRIRVEVALEHPAPITLTLRDLTGRRLGEHGFNHSATQHTAEWELRGFPDGFYLLETRSGRYQHVQKIVKTQ